MTEHLKVQFLRFSVVIFYTNIFVGIPVVYILLCYRFVVLKVWISLRLFPYARTRVAGSGGQRRRDAARPPLCREGIRGFYDVHHVFTSRDIS